MLGGMGYTEKLQQLCALRGLDQSALAGKLGLSKSSVSRILSGAQEPKLRLAYDLAKVLGVTLDYLVDDSLEVGFQRRSHRANPRSVRSWDSRGALLIPTIPSATLGSIEASWLARSRTRRGEDSRGARNRQSTWLRRGVKGDRHRGSEQTLW